MQHKKEIVNIKEEINDWTVDIFRKKWKKIIFKAGDEAFIDIGDSNLVSLYWICRYHERLKIGKASIGQYTMMNAMYGIVIEDFVQLGSHCDIFSVTTHWAGKFGKVTIKKNARIGNHVFIMPGVTIGKNAIIGAFSFVNRDIPDNTLAYGIPVRIKRDLTKSEINKLEEVIKDL